MRVSRPHSGIKSFRGFPQFEDVAFVFLPVVSEELRLVYGTYKGISYKH
jgi:hypothetical protein